MPAIYCGNYYNAEGMAVYYVIQVAPGKEIETEKHIMERVPKELYASCFHPVRHVRKKFRGKWRDRYEKLLPGYVFINSEAVEKLYFGLRRIPMMTKLLGWEEEFIIALDEQEKDWLEKMISADQTGRVNGEVPLSQIEVNEENEVKILSGPLKNMSGMVKKINLHRRIAEVEVEFMGRMVTVHLGIEIIKKQ